jgi:PhzF family phenazine biosynthesis protein
MKRFPLYQVDAFASHVFEGNPAAVCLLPEWLDDGLLQKIAAENNLSETAFLVKEGQGYRLRWFMPKMEVDLCGHATLAAAYVVFHFLGCSSPRVTFYSHSGDLHVTREGSLLQLDFPALAFKEIAWTDALRKSVGQGEGIVYESTYDVMVVLPTQEDVRKVTPHMALLATLPYRGLIVTSLTSEGGIYSRCFYPKGGAPEDPVTGSAHCVLAPYWFQRLGQQKIQARQGLSRQGSLVCEVRGSRVLLAGECQLYFRGEITI